MELTALNWRQKKNEQTHTMPWHRKMEVDEMCESEVKNTIGQNVTHIYKYKQKRLFQLRE